MKNSTRFFFFSILLSETNYLSFRLPQGWYFFLFCGLFLFGGFFYFFWCKDKKSELLQKYIFFGHHKNMFVWLLDAKYGGILIAGRGDEGVNRWEGLFNVRKLK